MRYLILFILFFISSLAKAKEYPTLHYGIEDGLPSNMIYDIYQDPDGFIWIGTDKGVARYNGQKFETFTTADGLSDNECFSFQQDHEGRLWIGTFNGELCYYKDGIFHNAKNTPWLKLSFKASITCFININHDSSINIFFKDHSGFLEIKDEKIKHFTPKCLAAQENNYCVYIQKMLNNQYKIFFSDKIVTIDQSSTVLGSYQLDNFKLVRLANGKNKKIFVTEKSSYLNEQLEPVHIENISLNKSIVIYRYEESIKGPLISTSKGLFLNGINPVFPNQVIHDALQDNEGNYWIGTAVNGVYKLDKDFPDSWKLDILKKPITYAQTTNDYLFFADKGRNTFRIKNNSDKIEPFFNFTNPDGIEYGLDCIQWIADGVYYNLSHNHNFRITEINSKNYKIKKINVANLGGLNGVYYTDSFLYLRARMFFNIMDPKCLNNRGKVPFIKAGLKDRMEAIYASAVDYKNQFWSSSLDCVYKITGHNRIVQPQFGKLSFRQFVFMKECLIGISHYNELLLCNNYESGNLLVDTLRSNDCVWDKFYKLNDTTLLISSNNYFRILNIHIKNPKKKYTIRLLENPFVPYQPEYLFIDSNYSYFFKNGVLSTFPTNYIFQKKVSPKLKFLFLKTGQSKVFIKDSMVLNYNLARNIKIDFRPISFNHKNLKYEYAINSDGNDSWNMIAGEELNLIKIGYGNFRIKIRAKTMSGEYSQPIAFTLIIKKPFWATYWFIAILTLLAISVIAVIARWSIKRNLRKKENEVRFLRSEYKALNALMNPHFIFNSLNSVQSLVNNNENNTASKYIRIFSDLIRQNMRNISQDLIPLSKELSLVENYLRIEQLRFKSKLSFEINIDDNVETDLILIPPLLIQPLVENSIKHGIWPLKSRNGNLKISIYEKEELLFIEIIDNGVGLKKKTSDTMHESYAMGNIYKRIEQLSQIHEIDIKVDIQEIQDETGNVSGVKAEITIRANNHA